MEKGKEINSATYSGEEYHVGDVAYGHAYYEMGNGCDCHKIFKAIVTKILSFKNEAYPEDPYIHICFNITKKETGGRYCGYIHYGVNKKAAQMFIGSKSSVLYLSHDIKRMKKYCNERNAFEIKEIDYKIKEYEQIINNLKKTKKGIENVNSTLQNTLF